MTKTKSTKRALLMSALALLMCVSMLIGSTFAWFTDSATSGSNKIQAGKLDVELLMWDGDSYENISTNKSPIFGTGSIAQNNNAETLWEPGKTQVAYLAIENKGSLDLKYTVALDVENVSKDLYKVMEYAITNDAKDGTGVNSWAGNGKAVTLGKQSVSGNVALKSGETHYFALSIHMSEAAGNEYQGGEVNFDLTVLATQLASESDSFNNQYDANAHFDLQKDDSGAYLLFTADDMMAFNEWMNQAGFNGEGRGPVVKLMADIDMTGYDWLSINEMFMTFDGNGHTISNLNCVENGSKSGFFGYLGGATIKNLTLNNVTSVGSQAGIFAGQSEGSKIINCNITGSNYVAWDNDSGDAITKNGIGAYVGVSVDAIEISGTIKQGTEIILNTNGMTGGWDNVDKYAGGLYNQPQTINVTDLGDIAGLTYVSEGLYKDDAGTYQIANATGLATMRTEVSDEATYDSDGSWALLNNIDLKGIDWAPINGFHGTFDGNGKVISNLTVSTDGVAGLFGINEKNGDGLATQPIIKNLTVSNANITGNEGVAVIVGNMGYATIENVKVIGATVNGNKYVGGIIGKSYTNGGVVVSDCSVSGSTIKAEGANADGKVGGIGGFVAHGTVKNNTVTGCTISAPECVGGIVGRGGSGETVAYIYGNTVSGNTVTGTETATVGDLIGDKLNVKESA